LPEGDTVEPDVSFVSRARWDAMDPPREGEFLKVVPDLVVEILSASTRLRDSGEKKAIYERNGVGEYWLADPRDRQLTVFLSREGRFDSGRVLTEDEDWESVVLPGLTCRVAGGRRVPTQAVALASRLYSTAPTESNPSTSLAARRPLQRNAQECSPGGPSTAVSRG